MIDASRVFPPLRHAQAAKSPLGLKNASATNPNGLLCPVVYARQGSSMLKCALMNSQSSLLVLGLYTLFRPVVVLAQLRQVLLSQAGQVLYVYVGCQVDLLDNLAV